MARSKSWSVKGVSDEAREAARRTAADTGMGIGEWIDAAILWRTANDGQPPVSRSPAAGPSDPLSLLAALERSIATQDDRLRASLESLAKATGDIEARLDALEERHGTDADPLGEGGAEEQQTGDATHASLFADRSFAERKPGESDHATRPELEVVSDDGDRFRRDQGASATGYDIAPMRTGRRRVALLATIGGVLAVVIALVAFIWSELTPPQIPPQAPPADTGPLASTGMHDPAAPVSPAAEGTATPPPPAGADSIEDAESAAFAGDANVPDTSALESSTSPAPASPPATAGHTATGAQTRADEPPDVQQLRQAAEGGSVEAQNDLAVRHLVGRGVPQDYEQAAAWLRRAAAGGVASAQYNLGVLHDSGRGVPADPVEALIWFHSAAEQGHGRAQYALAAAYAAGRGIPRNPEESLRWLERAAQSNVVEAQTTLADIYSDAPRTRNQLVDALFWYRVADANGAPDAGDAADALAARLNAEERAAVNRRVSSFVSEHIVRRPAGGSAGTTRSAPTAESAPSVSHEVLPSTEQAAPAPRRDSPPTGETILEIQSLLTTLGFDPGPTDGRMGALTRDAIVEYQRALGLEQDGRATRELLRHLRAVAGVDGS